MTNTLMNRVHGESRGSSIWTTQVGGVIERCKTIMTMRIKKDVLIDLLASIPNAPPEMGGALGGNKNVILTYMLDIGTETNNYDHYFPNVEKINHEIKNWMHVGIEFYGIFHSHFPGGDELSLSDKRYIRQIMLAMPFEVSKLYFPIILPTGIVGYQANRCGSQICIFRDDIKII